MSKDGPKGGIKTALKPIYRRFRSRLATSLHGHGPNDLAQALRTLRIAPGDTVFAHGGYSRDSGFTGSPAEVLDVLEAAVAPAGNLLMMSMPYRGASADYVATDPLFDIAATPTALGVLPELFRRRAGVLRSASPLHPVLAGGPLAAWLTLDHDLLAHSCGRGTPFERFLKVGGKALFYDAPYTSLTYMHYVEDHFRERLPVPLYDAEPASVRLRDVDGEIREIQQYCFSAAARASRDFSTIERCLVERGLLRATRVGRARLLCVEARAVFDCAQAVLEMGNAFYRQPTA